MHAAKEMIKKSVAVLTEQRKTLLHNRYKGWLPVDEIIKYAERE